jgi:transcriptional regulator GlxA family with amidase domain
VKKRKKKPLVLLLATPDSMSSIVYGMYDVLSMAGSSFHHMVTGIPGENLLDVRIIASSNKPFRCHGGILVEPHVTIAEVAVADVVVICNRYINFDSGIPECNSELISWLHGMYRDGSMLTSICSGATILADTGLLDGRTASSHWGYRHLYHKRYPEVDWNHNLMLCVTGDDKRIVTTGGDSAWRHLALYLIGLFCGRQQAIESSKSHLLSVEGSGQLPYASMIQNRIHNDEVIESVQNWIRSHYQLSKPVEEMARQSGLTTRTFARRFRAATGYYPLEYVQGFRIEVAKKLLESTPTSIEEISDSVGYEDTASFRRLFKRLVNTTPTAYRNRFIGILG